MLRPSRQSIAILLALLAVLFTTNLNAHPGGTDANGGHYNRKTGEYHLHTGNKSSAQTKIANSQVVALSWTGKVVGVSDGDTIKVLRAGQQVKIRLYGVDTPEKKQAFGQAAKRFTAGLVAGKEVAVEPIDIDRYGRTVGLVTVDGVSLNRELIRGGFAWYYGQYCKKSFCADWQGLEAQARAAGVGLWAEPAAQAPWDWRKDRRK